MKSRPTQFGVREHTASPRQHASRPVIDSDSNPVCIEDEIPQIPRRVTGTDIPASSPAGALLTPSLRAATGEGERASFEGLAVSVPDGPARRPQISFEPLINSPEAAKLLGDIHVKTLQRYARRGSLPGYQIGGHWFFRASELDAWLRSRINSSCHPCRSN
jgi:excisionase family DNA binding protein